MPHSRSEEQEYDIQSEMTESNYFLSLKTLDIISWQFEMLSSFPVISTIIITQFLPDLDVSACVK